MSPPGHDRGRPTEGGLSVEKSGGLSDTNRIPPTPANAVDGAQTAERNADAWTTDTVRRAIRDLAVTGRIFSADHLDDMGIVPPDSPSRIGGIFMGLSRAGVIECVGVTTSRRPSRQGGLTRLWRGTEAARLDAANGGG